jgi:hypothetical protein
MIDPAPPATTTQTDGLVPWRRPVYTPRQCIKPPVFVNIHVSLTITGRARDIVPDLQSTLGPMVFLDCSNAAVYRETAVLWRSTCPYVKAA